MSPPAPQKQNCTLATVQQQSRWGRRGGQAFAKDLGGVVPIWLHIDSSAALSIVSRNCLGKAKHIEIQYLCLQEAVRNNKLTVEKIPSETNSSDLGTKHLISERSDVDEARDLLLCMRPWVHVRVTNLARTGRG